MTRRLMGLAKGKVLVVLEGGYNIEATALAAESTVRV
jgi:acetoin utilization deacetylase AcuC-like enzyme